MADTWKSIFKGTVEGRPVDIQIYDEGACRVRTDQGADDPGTVRSDGSSHLIMTPTGKGRPIDIEEESPDEFRRALISEGFSEKAADEIVGKLPAWLIGR